MSDTTHKNYHVSQKEKLIKELDKVVSRVQPELVARYGEADAGVIHKQILIEFEHLLPQIPYIGGRKNSLTVFLLQSAWALAFYRVLQRHGGSVELGRHSLSSSRSIAFSSAART